MLHIAVRFYEKGLYDTNQPAKPGSRRRIRMAGYQTSKEAHLVLKVVLPDLVGEIPRSRIATYQYITLTEQAERWQAMKSHFLIPVEESLLPRIEQVTKAMHNPPVYLWRDSQWWTFPQLELYNTGEKTTITTTIGDIFGKVHETRTSETDKMGWRIRETYVPLPSGSRAIDFIPPGAAAVKHTSTGTTNPAGYPTTITGNGMVLEWKRGYEDKQPVWWLRDEQRVSKAQSATYKHYAVIKATAHARWSKSFSSWYYTGGMAPPAAWLKLVGYQPDSTPPTAVAPEMPAELSTIIEAALGEDEAADLMPLALLEANYQKGEWNYGNPQVWAKLFSRRDHWLFFAYTASLTERSVYGYRLQLEPASENQPARIVSGTWETLLLPELDHTHVRRDADFIRQPLRRAVEFAVMTAGAAMSPALGIPTEAECRQKDFEAKHHSFMAELERKRNVEAALKPYHQFHAMRQASQRCAETLHHLHYCKLLPAVATPSLDDPWS